MLSYFRWVLFFVALFVTLMGGALWLGNQLLGAAGPLSATKNIVIPRGAGPQTMAKVLKEEGVIDHERLFRVAVMIDPTPKPIKAGEYEIPAHISMLALLDLLQSGKQVQRRLTVVEGMTTPEVIDLVKNTPALSGEITLDLKEGDLLPETYFYSRDDTRDGLLMRMKEAMDKTLDEAWRKRAAGLPLANRREALTLGLDHREGDGGPGRARQGGRRLHQPPAPAHEARERPDDDLRHHPGQGAAQPRADARRSAVELRRTTPTSITGLPPGPICNPGRASILAATNPARDRALYFVADGQGGHAFAGTLAEHNRNVERWRQIQRERAEQQQQRRRRRARPARRPRLLPASSVRRRDREPCRPSSWPWSSSPSSLSASPGSCAPIRPRWRAACAWCWSCWAPSPSAAC